MSEPIITKHCSDCKTIKPISEFHNNKSQKDGKNMICKACSCFRSKRFRQTKEGKIYQQQYSQSENGRLAQKKYSMSERAYVYRKQHRQRKDIKLKISQYRKSEQNKQSQRLYLRSEKGKISRRLSRIRNREKIKARNSVRNEIKQNRLFKPFFYLCRYCNTKKAQQYHHHLGYMPEHWLDITPVCIPCHIIIHLKDI